MEVILSNNIRLYSYPLPLKLQVTEDLTMDNPAYVKAKRQRRPTWGIDQKLRLYTYDSDGSLVLPRGYYGKLKERLKGYSYGFKTDQVKGNDVDFGPWNGAYELKDYQVPLVDALRHGNGIAVSPAGSGKTIMGMRFIYETGKPTLWLTHTKDLLYQTKERAKATLQGVGRIGILGDGKRDYGDGKLIIATVQTLTADPSLIDFLVPYIGVVVIDEAHHFPARQFIDTAARFKASVIVGLTATPDRKDGMEDFMYMGVGPVLYEVDRSVLYQDDQLVLPEVRFVYTNYVYEDAQAADGNVDAGGEDIDYADLINSLVRNDERAELVAKSIVDAIPQGKAIVIAESVRYCFILQQKVRRMAKEQGLQLNTAVVHGGLSRYAWRVAYSKAEAEAKAAKYGTEYKYFKSARRYKVKTPQYTQAEFDAWQITPTRRKEILKACGEQKIDVLFATQLAREGLDFPHLSVGHSVTPKKGDSGNNKDGAALEQEIGRIMRRDPNNPDKKAVWYDYVDGNVGIFKQQYYSRRKVYKRLGVKLASKPRNQDAEVLESLLDNIKF